MAKKIKYGVDGLIDGKYVRAWKERREYIVQVWKSGKPEGEPDGDWAMPSVLGLRTAVDQAIAQTD